DHLKGGAPEIYRKLAELTGTPFSPVASIFPLRIRETPIPDAFVLVQLPLPAGIDNVKVLERIHPDVVVRQAHASGLS
ncbi:hypothetical protein O5559_29085, partial [Escherichia coli]|nr:hypothetical protein [Escherichia coli]